MTDAEIELTIYGSQKGYPEHLRLVRFFDEEQGREFMFLTNAMELTALQVSGPLQESLADRAFLQVAQAAPQNQEILGNN
ncbi:hypothetical protein [Prevotella sp. HUN102]|uniref:hypothetical protein n=1 Tax=Prevotella sp. HUN102 TaxID=1392486 RepID=UPI000B1192E2|nr:hypothetical protein [Prevotella sp. HUN102]